MSEVTKPIALDESFNTTGQTPKNIADVIKNGLQEVAQAIDSHQGGGGHVILDQNGNALDQEPNMQFVDAHTSDDSVNAKTIIENIKSVTEAQFESATEDGLYDVDVEGAEIGEISEDYVEVTADGVKTYGTLLNELFTKIDFEKITLNSHIRGLQDIFFLRRITSNLLIFSGFRISATNGYYESINLESNNSTMYLSTYTKSSGNWTIDNETNSIVSSGTKITLYYGNKKAVVDLQTTANRCLMSDGESVENALKFETFNLVKVNNADTINAEMCVRIGKVVYISGIVTFSSAKTGTPIICAKIPNAYAPTFNTAIYVCDDTNDKVGNGQVYSTSGEYRINLYRPSADTSVSVSKVRFFGVYVQS